MGIRSVKIKIETGDRDEEWKKWSNAKEFKNEKN